MQTVLITGASSGIGLELAKIFAHHGFHLVLVVRRKEQLEQLASELQKADGVSCVVLTKDLTQPSAAQEIYQQLKSDFKEIDILVNNAGFGTYGPFFETDLREESDMIQLNISALTQLTKLFGREMKRRGRGKILNVASTAAFQPGPTMAVYYATKAYVLSFSEALREELRSSGVSVTTLCPGPTTSGFQARSRLQGSRMVSGRVGAMMTSAEVAHLGFEGLMKQRSIVITGFKNRLMANLVRFAPREFVLRAVHWMQRAD